MRREVCSESLGKSVVLFSTRGGGDTERREEACASCHLLTPCSASAPHVITCATIITTAMLQSVVRTGIPSLRPHLLSIVRCPACTECIPWCSRSSRSLQRHQAVLFARSIRTSIHSNDKGKTSVQIDGEKESLIWKDVGPASPADLSVYYLRLSKFRLTSLVVATTFAGFAMGSPDWAFNGPLLAATLVGTGLSSASAASLNQFLEVPFDSQMARTRSRPIIVGQLTPFHAFNFAVVCGLTGLSLLYFFVNPLTALLGAVNLVLYSFIYTPMKRMNVTNTWIGSFVGAIPPVMGFTAATGLIDMSGLLLGAILYSWQFPHFNALSWNLRHDYARAGYRMMSVTDPNLCLRTQMRHSLLLTSYCLFMSHPVVGLTTWTFAADTLPFNLYLIYLSYKFYSDPSAASSRKLFRYSLIHLPAIIILMIISKNASSDREM